MIDALISSKTRIKLLLKFFLNSHATAYLRSLESEFGESSNGIRLELNRLEKAGLLCSESEGNKKIFRANTTHPLFSEIHNIVMKHIGLDQVVSLAMATSVIYQFKGIPNTLFNMESFWRHSIATGMAARTIGQVRKDPNVERLYLCGILHDLGRLILYIKEPGLARDTLMESRDGATNLHLVEMQQMGFDHAAVGAALLRFWQLPERLVQAVGYHHDPQAAPKYQAEAGIVHTADYIVHDMSLAQTEEFSIPNLQKDTWSRIGVDPKELAPQISKMSEQFEDTVRIFL